MPNKFPEVPIDRLHKHCDPEILGFESTEELPTLPGTIGQERAQEALDFGLQVKTFGFNLFAVGVPGTGRTFAVTSQVRQLAEQEPAPADWCYLHDFEAPDSPIAVSMPAGMGNALAKDMQKLVDGCRREIPRAFESEEYQKRRAEVGEEFQEKRGQLLSALEQEAQREGVAVQITPMGVVTVPLIEGRPMTREEFQNLPDQRRKELEEKAERIKERVGEVMSAVRKIDQEIHLRVDELDKQVALFAIGHLLADLRCRHGEIPRLLTYLDQVETDILKNLNDFRPEEAPRPRIPGLEGLELPGPSFDRYRVNVLVDNGSTKGAPVLVELNPTYYNLMGKLEYRARFGGMTTDFNMIKPGALHRANGGYLVLQAYDVLTNPFSWDALKRALRGRQICIENIGQSLTPIPAATLQPEPIPLDVKVVLVGPPLLYQLLLYHDEEFRKLFKVKADFELEMELTPEHVRAYGVFVATRCRDLGLRHFHREAVARVVEYGSRLAGDQDKITSRFQAVDDLIAEANFWAGRHGHPLVGAADIDKALEKKEYRSKYLEERILEMIQQGTLMIDTEGQAVGQVNGLSIIDLGDYVFGRPSRITARTMLGRGNLVNIEREASLSGNLFNKAVLILSGYLAGKFAHDKPLTVSVTLGFEQSYEMVEGDSASCAELYAIISSLADLPLKQGIAVSGSVNQHGQVQPVGGITRKIEGFFAVCRSKGLTGKQGVIIPHQNVRNLMLKDQVVDAIKKGRFHVWPVKAVEEGIEILTGVPAGQLGPEGTYPPDSVFDRVDRKLRHYAELAKSFAAPPGERREHEEAAPGTSLP